MKNQIVVSLIAVLTAFAVGCGTAPTSTGSGGVTAVGTNNVVMQFIHADIASGALQWQTMLAAQGAVMGCQIAKVPGYQHQFALVNKWATLVNAAAQDNKTPLTTAQMQDLAAKAGIQTSDAVALGSVNNMIIGIENWVVAHGGTANDAYQAILQMSAGAKAGTDQFAGQ